MKTTIPKPVIVCIGTPKVIGDSLGPKVGDLLIGQYDVNAYVYGKTSSPVTGVNCEQYFAHIRNKHKSSLIVAVDACLGRDEDVGTIKYSTSGLRAGSALGKDLGTFGDVGFLGVVAKVGKDNLRSLLHADEENVTALSEKIAEKIQNLLSDLRLTYNF